MTLLWGQRRGLAGLEIATTRVLRQLRENIDRGLHDGDPAEDQNQKGHYNERIRPVKGDPYNPHIFASLETLHPLRPAAAPTG
jgi:hypothetical protein